MKYKYLITNLQDLMSERNLKNKDMEGLTSSKISKIKALNYVLQPTFDKLYDIFGDDIEYQREEFKLGRLKVENKATALPYEVIVKKLQELRKRKGIKTKNSIAEEHAKMIAFENEKTERIRKLYGLTENRFNDY